MANSIARRGAVQLVTLASATLSAAYYYGQAPDIHVTARGMTLAPIAIGLGLIAFALDALKPEAMRIACDPGAGTPRRAAASIFFFVLFLSSIFAVDGVLLKNRSDWAAERTGSIDQQADVSSDVKRLDAELVKVVGARTPEQVRAAMDGVKISARVFRNTTECTKPVDDDDRRQCRPILDLREEMAGAIRKADVEVKLVAARVRRAAGHAPKSADPQADTLSRVFGVTPDTIAYVITAVFGFGIELGACLSLWLLQTPEAASKAAAKTADLSAKFADALANLADASAKAADTSAKSAELSPKSAELSPKRRPARPLAVDASAKGRDASAMGAEVRAEIESFVLGEVSQKRSIASQSLLAAKFRCAESTVSEALSGMEARNVIARLRVGRCKMIVAAA